MRVWELYTKLYTLSTVWESISQLCGRTYIETNVLVSSTNFTE